MWQDHVVRADAVSTRKVVWVEMLIDTYVAPALHGHHSPKFSPYYSNQRIGQPLILQDAAAGNKPEAFGRTIVAPAKQDLVAPGPQNQID